MNEQGTRPGEQGTAAEAEAPATYELRRPDQLPPMVRVEWRRGDRVQTSVGFLVADGPQHMVLSGTYDGKHPAGQRIWTIHREDVLVREALDCRGMGATE